MSNTAPRPIVVEALRYVHEGTALDLGCGLGRDALFLASRSFEADAVDADSSQLQTLERKAVEHGV